MIQFVKFLSVGIVATAAHYACMVFCVEFLEIAPPAASSAGFIVGAGVSYLLNYKVTFNSNRSHLDSIARFTVGSLFAFIVNFSILIVGVSLFKFNYIIIQAFATAIVFFLNFAVGKFWIYKRK